MAQRFDVPSGRRSGSILGATHALFLGSIVAGVISGFLGSDLGWGFYTFAGGVVAIIAFLLISRTRPAQYLSEAVSWMLIRHKEDDLNYEPGPKTRSQNSDRSGTRKPPTVEEVRDIKANSNNWVPARGTRNGPPQ